MFGEQLIADKKPYYFFTELHAIFLGDSFLLRSFCPRTCVCALALSLKRYTCGKAAMLDDVRLRTSGSIKVRTPHFGRKALLKIKSFSSDTQGNPQKEVCLSVYTRLP